jgi:hypothetical protein
MDGPIEWKNAALEKYLHVLTNRQQYDWENWLTITEFAANNGTSESTRFTLFFQVQGINPRMSYSGEPRSTTLRECMLSSPTALQLRFTGFWNTPASPETNKQRAR